MSTTTAMERKQTTSHMYLPPLTHPSHVAGTVGGAKYGVAKKTNIVGVKVLDGSTGSASDVFAGFDWTVNDIVSKGRQNTAVINMSLGSSASTTWDAAITAAWKKGVLVVTAAGNENQPAINNSPARSPEVICVGNIEINNKRHSGGGGSNYGAVVDIFAGGTNIVSASHLSDSETRTLTGTSMASPHVAGLVSYLRALEGPSTAADVKARVYALGTPNVVTDPLGSVNLLAFNGNSMMSVAGSSSNSTQITTKGTGDVSNQDASPSHGTAVPSNGTVPCNGTIEARTSWKLW
jgi:oryzin